MPLKKQSKMPKKRQWNPHLMKALRLPIPLLWGLLAILLFMGFTVVTQAQFNKINKEQIYRARIDAYLLDVQVYEASVRERLRCLEKIENISAEREIYQVISSLFDKSASLPAAILPDSLEAKSYQAEMKLVISQTLDALIEKEIIPEDESDCPKVADEPPTIPEK